LSTRRARGAHPLGLPMNGASISKHAGCSSHCSCCFTRPACIPALCVSVDQTWCFAATQESWRSVWPSKDALQGQARGFLHHGMLTLAYPVDPFDLCHHFFRRHPSLCFLPRSSIEVLANVFISTGDDVGDGPAGAQLVGCLEFTKH